MANSLPNYPVLSIATGSVTTEEIIKIRRNLFSTETVAAVFHNLWG
jgi:hypothetical protein